MLEKVDKLIEEVEMFTSIYNFGGHVNFSTDEDKYHERSFLFVDQNFLQVFDYALVSGDVNSALSQPSSVIIDEQWANTLFGTSHPLGKTIVFNGIETGLKPDLNRATDTVKSAP